MPCLIVAKADAPQATPAKKEHHGEKLLAPGSPVSQHSSTKSDEEVDDDHDRKKVKKQRSFKKMFQKKPHKKK